MDKMSLSATCIQEIDIERLIERDERLFREWQQALIQAQTMRTAKDFTGVKTIHVAQPELTLLSSYHEIFCVAPNLLLCCRDHPR